jgi:hypothetical protein
MASKRKASTGTGTKMNFRPQMSEATRETAAGRRPLPDRSSVSSVVMTMVQHVCKKVLFVDTRYRVSFYCGVLFILSLIADVMPIPKTFLSRYISTEIP